MTKRSYYGRCLTIAVRGAWATYNFAIAILVLLIPLVLTPLAKWYSPAVERAVPDLAWQIPLVVLGLFFVARIFLASYWIAEEQEQETKKLRETLDQIPVLNQRLTTKEEENERLWHDLTATRITTSVELAAVFRTSFVREAITASHIEGNAIVLTYTPIPDSVHLIITSMIYVASNTRGISVRGRKIFLENTPNDIQFLDSLQSDVSSGSVTVEYHRCFSAEELEEIKRKQ